MAFGRFCHGDGNWVGGGVKDGPEILEDPVFGHDHGHADDACMCLKGMSGFLAANDYN